MTNLMAAISEGSSMGQAYENKEQAFVFRIPVYQNMPETAVIFTEKGVYLITSESKGSGFRTCSLASSQLPDAHARQGAQQEQSGL